MIEIKISHYFEWEDQITGGHLQSVKNQRKILEQKDIDYTTEPDLDADILHLNNMGPKSIYYARKAKKKDIPVVIHTHQTAEDFKDSFIFSNILAIPMKPYLKYAYSLADHLICPSEYNRKTIEKYSDAPKSVISNGFDYEKLEGFEDLRDEYLQRYDLEPPVVFNVGHVIKRKGLKSFIDAARKLPELDFVWFGFLNPMGEGSSSILQGWQTKKMVDNAPQNCTFTGYIDDIRGGFAAGDIFFFPTKNENEGIALLESMACGKPPLVRDIETFEWMEDGENCLKSESDFEKKLEKLKDPELRKQIGQKAKEKSREFELDNVGDDLIPLYEDLI